MIYRTEGEPIKVMILSTENFSSLLDKGYFFQCLKHCREKNNEFLFFSCLVLKQLQTPEEESNQFSLIEVLPCNLSFLIS